jgi:hypothetical protein
VLILGLIVVVLLGSAGLMLVLAGRNLESSEEPGALTSFVDSGLQRTRTAVDTLIQPDVTAAEVRPSRHALSERATTYAVFGAGLVGIVAFVVVGMVLVRG